MNIYIYWERERESLEYHNSYNNFGNEDDIELVMVMDSIMMLVVKVVVKAIDANWGNDGGGTNNGIDCTTRDNDVSGGISENSGGGSGGSSCRVGSGSPPV